MIEYKKIECPSCQWKPNSEKLWSCTCKFTWDTFTTKGKCPSCLTQWEDTYCPTCGTSSKHNEWYQTGNSQFEHTARIFNVDIDDIVIDYWNKFYDKEYDEQLFQFRKFGSFKTLTPKGILYVSHKLNVNNDKVHVNNIFGNILGKGKIDEETYKRFTASTHTDILLISRDYKNRLHKYHYPFFEINSIIPIGISQTNGSYLVLGYVGRKCKGVYLLNEDLDFPFFISDKLEQFFNEMIFSKEGSSRHSPNNFEFKNPILNVNELNYDFGEESNIDFNIDDIINFYKSELKRVFGIVSNVVFQEERVSMEMTLNGNIYSIKINVKNNKSKYNLIDRFNTFLNQTLERKYALDLKYAFYRIDSTFCCYPIDKIMEGAKQGIIPLTKTLHLPKYAFAEVNYPAIDEDYLKDKPVDDFDENTKLVLLSDISRY